MRIYLLRIQGLGDEHGQLVGTWPRVPAYAAGEAETYLPGALAQEPIGAVSARWDVINARVSTGRWRVVLSPRHWPIPLRAIQPTPLNAVRNEAPLPPWYGAERGLPASETVIDMARNNANSGIAPGDVLYCGSETWLVQTASASFAEMAVGRGHAGSLAVPIPHEAEIFRSPPALVGRRATLHRVEWDAANSTHEVLIAAGVVASEPSWGPQGLITIEALSDFGRVVVGTPDWTSRAYCSPVISHRHYPPRPAGHQEGAYLYWPSSGEVREAEFASAFGVNSSWTYPADGYVWPPAGDGLEPGADAEGIPVLYSDADLRYPAWRYWDVGAGAWVASDHPAVITLCTLLSRDGANWAGGDARRYDQGDHRLENGGLYPNYAAGVPREWVETAAFEALEAGELAGVRAKCLWLGGHRGEPLVQLLQRLWAPLGYVVGTDSAGRWTVDRLGDVYPGGTSELAPALIQAEGATSVVRSRHIRGITLWSNPGPDGESVSPVRLVESGTASYYPEDIGEVEERAAVPYPIDAYDDVDSPMYGLLMGRLRRLARRVLLLRDLVGEPTLADAIGWGTRLALHDLGLHDPVSGARLLPGDYLTGVVTSVEQDMYRRTVRYELACLPQPKIATWSASARVTGYLAGPPPRVAVDAHEYSLSGEDEDCFHFAVGWRVALLDERLARRDDNGPTITDVGYYIGTPSLAFDEEFEAGGSPITPTSGDLVVLVEYLLTPAALRETYAWAAAGGSGGREVHVGGDAPYRYGD